MGKVTIDKTVDTPAVEMDPKGVMKLEGRAMPENPINFFKQLYEWAGSFAGNKLNIDFKLEYFNTASSKCLMDLLQAVQGNPMVKKVHVNWHYEEGDDDTFEAGEVYKDAFKDFDFEFFVYAEI